MDCVVRSYTLMITKGRHKLSVVSMEVQQYGDIAWSQSIREQESGLYFNHFQDFAEELISRGVVVISGYMIGPFARASKKRAEELGYTAEITHKAHISHDDRDVYWVNVWLQDKEKVWTSL